MAILLAFRTACNLLNSQPRAVASDCMAPIGAFVWLTTVAGQVIARALYFAEVPLRAQEVAGPTHPGDSRSHQTRRSALDAEE